VDRSHKAAPKPELGNEHVDVIGGESNKGVKGWTGSGKGSLDHELKPKDPLTREKTS
jgi:hypothetical protein